MSDNIDGECKMCGRYGCDPKHHEPMSKQCSCGGPLPCRVSQLTVSDLRNAHYARGGIVDPPSSPVSVTKPAGGTGERRRALLARQERYSEAVYGDGRGVTPRVSDIMAIADDERRADVDELEGEVWALKSALSLSDGLRGRLTAEAEDSRVAYIALVAEQSAKINERDATIERLTTERDKTHINATFNRRAW